MKKPHHTITIWIEHHRFKLLLIATFLVLILPAFTGKGNLAKMMLALTMSFLFIQSMVVASDQKSKKMRLRYTIAIIMIVFFWLVPLGLEYRILDIIRMVLLPIFFVFVTFYLFKFMRRSHSVNINVIISAINIYLLIGIIFGSLALLFSIVYPEAYNIPESISKTDFTSFVYFSFVTMSTVGFGDITPRIPETQTLAFMTAITGQLYVAIIIAFLVGKLLMAPKKS